MGRNGGGGAVGRQRYTESLVRYEAFTVTECNEFFSGDQLCKYGVTIHCFGDCLCLHHQDQCDE
jgi:hypothetical protein